MYAGCGRAGDFAGDPVLTARGVVAWRDTPSVPLTQLRIWVFPSAAVLASYPVLSTLRAFNCINGNFGPSGTPKNDMTDNPDIATNTSGVVPGGITVNNLLVGVCPSAVSSPTNYDMFGGTSTNANITNYYESLRRGRYGITVSIQTRQRGTYGIATPISLLQRGIYGSSQAYALRMRGTYNIPNGYALRMRGTYRSVVRFELLQRGINRVANAAEAGWAVWVGVGGPPDLDAAPDALSAILPIQVPITPPGVGTQDFYVVVRRANEYKLQSTNQYPKILTVDSSGLLQRGAVPVPTIGVAAAIAGGGVRLGAEYSNTPPPDWPPDDWYIYLGAVAPVIGVDTPAVVIPATRRRLTRNFAGPYAPGTLHVAVALFRDVDSMFSEPARTTILIPSPLPIPGAVHSGYER